MPNAEIITIGTELLLGEIVDTNTQVIARSLRSVGINLYRTSTVGDNLNRIARVVRESLSRADIVITSGGLGPTVDDPTREAVSSALDMGLEFRTELWDVIQNRLEKYNREVTENNKRQAYIPEGAFALDNEWGTAPAFIVDDEKGVLICLPGVPPELERILEKKVLPWLRSRFSLQEIILTRSIMTEGIGESKVDIIIGDLERSQNPTVGLAAHKGSVELRITSRAETKEEAEREIQKMGNRLRERLSKWIIEDKSS
jgi:competence/damage-inducible protein CinA-like protein